MALVQFQWCFIYFQLIGCTRQTNYSRKFHKDYLRALVMIIHHGSGLNIWISNAVLVYFLTETKGCAPNNYLVKNESCFSRFRLTPMYADQIQLTGLVYGNYIFTSSKIFITPWLLYLHNCSYKLMLWLGIYLIH